MRPGQSVVGRAVRVLIALAAVAACLGAVVAFASTRAGGAPGLSARAQLPAKQKSAAQGNEALPQPSLIETPEATSVSSVTQFRFHIPPRSKRQQPSSPARPRSGVARASRRFQCRDDGGPWRACGSPHRIGDLPAGPHSLAVRAITRSGKPGPTTSYRWRQVEPKPIVIEAVGAVEDLSPGLPPQALPAVVSNPNDVPIEVTSLTVELSAAPPTCPAENFQLTPSSASATAALTVPAGGSVSLPAAGVSAPAIGMLDLPVNQDACRGARLQLVFEGEARG